MKDVRNEKANECELRKREEKESNKEYKRVHLLLTAKIEKNKYI